jgi:hypothetical protein
MRLRTNEYNSPIAPNKQSRTILVVNDEWSGS